MFHINLLHINIFYQYLADCLLNSNMHLFSLIQSLLLLIFYMDDVEYIAFWVIFVLFSFVLSSKFVDEIFFNIVFGNSVLHTFPAFVSYGYDVIRSNVSILLSSLLFSAILLTLSVNTLCVSLLNLCCDFNMGLLLNKQFL